MGETVITVAGLTEVPQVNGLGYGGLSCRSWDETSLPSQPRIVGLGAMCRFIIICGRMGRKEIFPIICDFIFDSTLGSQY